MDQSVSVEVDYDQIEDYVSRILQDKLETAKKDLSTSFLASQEKALLSPQDASRLHQTQDDINTLRQLVEKSEATNAETVGRVTKQILDCATE